MMHHHMPSFSVEASPSTSVAFSAVWPDFAKTHDYLGGFSTERAREQMLRAHDVDVFIDWVRQRDSVPAQKDYDNTVTICEQTTASAEQNFEQQFSLFYENALDGWQTRSATNLLVNSSFMQERALLERAITEADDPLICLLSSQLRSHSRSVLEQLCQVYEKVHAIPDEERSDGQNKSLDSLVGSISEMIGVHLANHNAPMTGTVALPAAIKEDMLEKTDLWVFQADESGITYKFPIQLTTALLKKDTCDIPQIAVRSLGYDTRQLAKDILSPDDDISQQRVAFASKNLQNRLRAIRQEWFSENESQSYPLEDNEQLMQNVV